MGFNNNYFKQTNNIFNLKLKPNQFTILSYLIRMSNEVGSCYPSMNNIAEMCSVSKSTVVRTIGELEEAGYINVNIDNTYNIYIINYDVIETINNRPIKNKNRRSNRKSSKALEEKVSDYSIGRKQLDNKVNFKKIEEDIESSIKERLIKVTGEASERVQSAIKYAQDKGAKDLFAYARDTIKDNWDNYGIISIDSYKNNNYNTMGFNNFEPREYDYESLERKLLGWE
ncbi:helix-turn-helix domain-containing protein [Clostridium paraputrificum]|uniref:helix-turn-helix domain-containing protein n=1 Tax=Clostridium paraputrificum TaxID=29363 RepID=UPI0018AC8A42|nr:helix-turn-helix domain-containing protein [Clostridium paraputrificum]